MNNHLIRILIAGDDKDDKNSFKKAIEANLPLAIISDVSDGIAALRHIKTSPLPDLVFLNLHMPLKNGLNCLKDIFNHKLLPGTPIIIYSTSNKLKDINEAYNYGAVFYIIKPVSSLNVLQEIIKYAICLLEKRTTEGVDKKYFVLSESKLAGQDGWSFTF